MSLVQVAFWFTGVCNHVLKPFGKMLCADVDYDINSDSIRVRSFSLADRPKYIGSKIPLRNSDSQDYVLGQGASKEKDS